MLELKNISVGYRTHRILQGIDLRFEPGMIYTIVGKNGSGKSTLLKCCAGLIQPQAGHILLNGKNLTSCTPGERAQQISYLSQERNTPNITVERLLAHSRFPHLPYPKHLRHEDREIIQKSLQAMQVSDYHARSLRELSGGERQRVYLAMQLAQDAQILLLDEPTTYLDIEYQLILMDLLAQLKSAGKTVLLVLHDLEQALRYSDSIIAIDAQKKTITGTPEMVLENGTLREIFHVDIQRSEYHISLRRT